MSINLPPLASSLMLKYLIVNVITFLSFFSTALGQYKEWTLEACFQKAIEKNIRLKQVRLQSKSAGVTLAASQAMRYPTLNANANHGYNFGRTIDPFTNTFGNQTVQSNTFNLTAGIVLFNGLQTKNSIDRDKKDKQTLLYEEQATTQEILLSVASLYLQVLLQSELLETSKQQLEISRNQLERTRKLTDAGRLSESDLIIQEAQVSNDEWNVINARSNERIAYVNLWQSMDEWPDTSYRVKPISGNIMPYTGSLKVEEIFAGASQQRPDIKAAQNRLESAGLQKKIANGARYPRLTAFGNINTLYSSTRKDILGIDLNGIIPIGFVSGSLDTVYGPTYSYRTQATPFSKQVGNNLGRSFGFSLNIPITNNRQVWAAMQRSNIQEEQAKLNLMQVNQNLLKSITQAVLDYQVAASRYVAARNNLEAQQKSFDFGKVRFENGVMSAVDFNTLRLNLSRAESSLTQARYEYIFRIKVLDFYQGKSWVE